VLFKVVKKKTKLGTLGNNAWIFRCKFLQH
jgi:hypothetical protein